MKFSYSYLNDKEFLKMVDNLHQKTLYVKIVALTWNEEPIEEIQGKATGGSLQVQGSSASRRQGSITMLVDDHNRNVYDVKNIISINKKISIEIGYVNTTDYYKQYDIIWIPLGIFILQSVNITHNLNSISMSLSFSDKMCLLDGSIGGTIGSAIDLAAYESDYDEEEYEDSVAIKYQYVSMFDLVKEVVHHLGGESLTNMIIQDIPEQIKYIRKFHIPTGLISVVYNILLVIENHWDYMNAATYEAQRAKIPKGIIVNPQDADGKSYFSVVSVDYDMYSLLVSLFPTIAASNKICSVYSDDDYKYKDSYVVYPTESLARDICQVFCNTTELFTATEAKEALENMTWYLYIWNDSNGIQQSYFTPSASYLPAGIKADDVAKYTIKNGSLLGYTLEDFTYSNSKKDLLTVQPGETVQSVLSKIVSKLGGNYEFFYDTEGVFHFQEIKNYLNTSKATYDLQQLKQDNNYLIDRTMGSAIYTFDNSEIVSNYNNTLLYSEVKNDYIIWGNHKTANGNQIAHRYHLAIDHKPDIGRIYDNIFFMVNTQGIEKQAKMAIMVDNIFDINTYGYYYYLTTDKTFYVYSKKLGVQPMILPYDATDSLAQGLYYQGQLTEMGELHSKYPNPHICYERQTTDKDGNAITQYWAFVTGALTLLTVYPRPELYSIKTTDYRSELLLQGLQQSILQSTPNNYYAELDAEWLKIYNLKAKKEGNYWIGDWREDIENSTTLEYYLELIDTDAAIGNFSISNIGKRTKAENGQSNCLFEPVAPDLQLLDAEADNLYEQIEECKRQHRNYLQLPHIIYKTLAGDSYQDAYNEIRNLLYQYTGYNEAVEITTLPIFHLDVNTRVTIHDTLSGIDGDYMISSYTVPFEIGGTTSFNCTKCLQKI